MKQLYLRTTNTPTKTYDRELIRGAVQIVRAGTPEEQQAFDAGVRFHAEYPEEADTVRAVLETVRIPAPPAPPAPPVKTKTCTDCGQTKPVTDFKRGHSRCRLCFNKSVRAKRQCVRCERLMAVKWFDGDSHVCRYCAREMTDFQIRLANEAVDLEWEDPEEEPVCADPEEEPVCTGS